MKENGVLKSVPSFEIGTHLNVLNTIYLYVVPLNDQPEIYEPLHKKTNNMHRQKKKAKVCCAQLISAFVFAIRIIQFLFFLNPKFQASNQLQRLYRPGQNPNCWFSHAKADMIVSRSVSSIFCLDSLILWLI